MGQLSADQLSGMDTSSISVSPPTAGAETKKKHTKSSNDLLCQRSPFAIVVLPSAVQAMHTAAQFGTFKSIAEITLECHYLSV
jgi:hypothetical protein